MFNLFQCQDIVSELEHKSQSYLLNQKMKEQKEKFQKFCGHVENEELFDLKTSLYSFSRFFGLTKETVATCSSEYRATPVFTSNGGWSVDESKHC